MTTRRRIALGIACSILVASSAKAETTLEVLHAWPGHARFHEPLAEAFMEQNPDIAIEFRVSPPNYQEAHLAITRAALTGNLPDIYFAGYSVLRPMVSTLEPRGDTVPLTPFLEAEGEEWVIENYAAAVLELGQVDEIQYGIPFNASTPIVYFNADLVREAGGDPDAFPADWDAVIALAAEIDALGAEIGGMDYSVGSIPGDWFFQAVILERGGDIVTDDQTAVGFDNEAGLAAMRFIRRVAEETNMAVATTPDPYRQQFFAGNLGLLIASPSGVRNFTEAAGDRFELRTAPYPVADKEAGGLPTGGNAAVILADDEDTQRDAWEYVKYVTGPEAQAEIAKMTGYMPTNKLSEPELEDFFAENPNFRTVALQMDFSRPWYGYPGPNGVEIWRAQREIVDRIQRGALSPEDGLAQIVDTTNAMLAD